MSSSPRHPILGRMAPHWAAEILGTGYYQFANPSGIGGLAKESEDGRTLDVLAVHAVIEGAGCFRDFITELKGHYNEICIWSITNEWLPDVLKRYGFKDYERMETVAGGKVELITGMRWTWSNYRTKKRKRR